MDVGLRGSLQYVEETNQDNLCQIIIITDGRPNSGDTSSMYYYNATHEQAAEEILSIVNDASSLIKIHVIAFGKEQDVDIELYKTIARLRFGTFQFVELPRNAHLLKHAFDTIIANSCTCLVWSSIFRLELCWDIAMWAPISRNYFVTKPHWNSVPNSTTRYRFLTW